MSEQLPILPPAGWYSDPLDETMERWWNGVEWSTTLRPKTAALPPVPPGASSNVNIPTSSKAVTVMILGVASIIMTFSFFLFALVPAIITLTMSKGAMKEIEQSNGMLEGKPLVIIGRVLAWIAIGITTFLTLVFGFLILVLIIGAVASDPSSVPTPTPTPRLR